MALSSDSVEMICDFFILLVHSVLRDRGVYPKVICIRKFSLCTFSQFFHIQELFEEVRHERVGSIPLPLCRHPLVTQYVHETLQDLHQTIQNVRFSHSFLNVFVSHYHSRF
jgi:hypothetical protein